MCYKVKDEGFLSAIYYITKYYKYHEIEPYKYIFFLNIFSVEIVTFFRK